MKTIKGDVNMIKSRKKVDNRARIEAIIRSDRTAIEMQKELESEYKDKLEKSEKDKWTISVFRKIKVGCKRGVYDWLSDKL